MNIKVLLTSILFFTSLGIVFSQPKNDLTLFDEIDKAALDLKKAIESNTSTKSIVKRLKTLSKKGQNNNKELAIINATIGKVFTEQKRYDKATYFYKKAFKYRKREGEFYPQRWALNSLIENGLENSNFKQTYKYGKKWISLTEENSAELESLYKYNKDGEKYFRIELEMFLLRIHPSYIPRWKKGKTNNWDQRRDYSLKILNFYLKKYPNHKQRILKDSKEIFDYGIRRTLKNESGSVAKEWAQNSLKMLKKHTNKTEYASFIKFFASQFKKREVRWSSRPKDTSFESIGIELMNDYINESKKIKNYEQVVFGYRYLAKRYKALNDYQKTVQYLATAIKYCRKYNLEKEVVKSFGGINQMLIEIGKDEAKVKFVKNMNWKNNYSLKGLLNDDIEEIDDILLSVDYFKY